jgi:hypothetical protein
MADINPYEAPRAVAANVTLNDNHHATTFHKAWRIAAYVWPLALFLLLATAQIVPIFWKVVFIGVSVGLLVGLVQGLSLRNCLPRFAAVAGHLFVDLLVAIFPTAVPSGPPRPYSPLTPGAVQCCGNEEAAEHDATDEQAEPQ